jgi:dihydroflavonol-4-reductase
MKKLVTGATGFIGGTIVRELLNRGEEVRVLIRKNSDTRNIAGLDVEIAYGDIRDGESVKAALKDCDTFFQTAALFAHWIPDKKLQYDINVNGTRIALTAALEANVDKVVYTSTNNAIGAHGLETPMTEEMEYNLADTGDHYSYTKYLAELEAKKLAEKGLNVVIVNPTMVIGTRDIKPTPSGKLIIDVANEAMPGYIDGGTNVIDVEDVAIGHILAAQKGRPGQRYLFGNQNITVGDYFNLIAEVAGVKAPRRKIPYPLAIAIGRLSGMVSYFTKKAPVVVTSELKIGKKGEFCNCSKAVEELGLPQTPIRDTIEKALNWFRENGYLKKP